MTKNKNQCMDCFEVKQDCIHPIHADITFKGWDIKNPLDLIKEEVEDFLETEIKDLKIIESKEIAYSSPRFCEGHDARDEGYSSWLNYHTTWKIGLGKCTSFKVTYSVVVINTAGGQSE